MAVTILIPTVLRPHTADRAAVSVEGKTVGDALKDLVSRHPGLAPHIFTEAGNVRSFVNVFVNEDDIRQKGGMKAAVTSGDEISIVPSIAGGANVTKEQVMELLATCYDPEIPVNIVDLGLVYEVAIDAIPDQPDKSKVHVKMTLTAPGCPEGPMMQSQTQAKLAALAGVGAAQVDLVWEPQWTPERMSEAARLELGMA